MKKLNLTLDALSVETFEPAPVQMDRSGTVKGNQNTPMACCTASCGGTCGADLSNLRQGAATVTNCPDCCA